MSTPIAIPTLADGRPRDGRIADLDGSIARTAADPTWILAGRVSPDSSTIEVAISSSHFTIGRGTENDLCVRNPTVSGRHADLAQSGSDIFVVDQQSTNGTFLNGRRVRGRAILRNGDILQFGTAVFELRQNSGFAVGATMQVDVATDALVLLEFGRLLSEPALIPYYQPIIELHMLATVGYEVLARSNLAGLKTPTEMFRVAATRNSEIELSQLSRKLGVHVARDQGIPLYINTHPTEVGKPCLLRSLEEIRASFPDIPLYLEIHEAAITSTSCLADLRHQLQDLNIGLAYDDFGAGQARLLELVEVPPDVIKFDMCLTRGLAQASGERQRLVQSLVDIVREFGVTTLAEGVETDDEVAICRQMGFELAQGFIFGRPQPIEVGSAGESLV